MVSTAKALNLYLCLNNHCPDDPEVNWFTLSFLSPFVPEKISGM